MGRSLKSRRVKRLHSILRKTVVMPQLNKATELRNARLFRRLGKVDDDEDMIVEDKLGGKFNEELCSVWHR